jgi:CDP-diglyceride synthetase
MIGVILGLFTLSLMERRSPQASLYGLLGGLCATMVVVFILPSLEIEPGVSLKIAWPWYGLISCAATYITGRAAQAIRNRN